MTNTPCPECKGRCCRDHYGYTRTHMGAEFYTHECEACMDGTEYTAPRTAADERADVLAYIERAIAYPFPVENIASPAGYLTMLHDLIAAGTHEGHAARRKP